MTSNSYILKGSIPKAIIKLTLPTIFGIISIILFNVVDTFFVGKLGVLELTAISFTFPIIMFVNSLNLGVAIAVMNLFARIVGEDNLDKKRVLATSSLLIGLIISIAIALTGYLTIEPLFKILGAASEVLPLINDYMSIWYWGSFFIIIPMIGGHILRGLGDTKTPSIIMFGSGLLNCFLDPLLIFGYGHLPALGVKGAALATVLSRMVAIFISLYIQIFRERLISFKKLTWPKIFQSWRDIFSLALPNVFIKITTPLGITFFTWILAVYGNEVVAGYGVAVKIEMFFLTVAIALGISTSIFAGQNIGAGNLRRAQKGFKYFYLLSFGCGFLYLIILLLGGEYLGSFFNKDSEVQKTVATYFRIVPWAYISFFIIQINFSLLNVLRKPKQIGFISIFQTFFLSVPLAFILSKFFEFQGVFGSIAISLFVTSFISWIVIKSFLFPKSLK